MCQQSLLGLQQLHQGKSQPANLHRHQYLVVLLRCAAQVAADTAGSPGGKSADVQNKSTDFSSCSRVDLSLSGATCA